MKLRNVFFVSMIVILLAGFITNPSKEEYITWSKEQLSTQADGGLEKGLLSLISGPLLRSSTVSKNLIFFSVYDTSIKSDENIKVLGVFKNFIPISKSQVNTMDELKM